MTLLPVHSANNKTMWVVPCAIRTQLAGPRAAEILVSYHWQTAKKGTTRITELLDFDAAGVIPLPCSIAEANEVIAGLVR